MSSRSGPEVCTRAAGLGGAVGVRLVAGLQVGPCRPTATGDRACPGDDPRQPGRGAPRLGARRSGLPHGLGPLRGRLRRQRGPRVALRRLVGRGHLPPGCRAVRVQSLPAPELPRSLAAHAQGGRRRGQRARGPGPVRHPGAGDVPVPDREGCRSDRRQIQLFHRVGTRGRDRRPTGRPAPDHTRRSQCRRQREAPHPCRRPARGSRRLAVLADPVAGHRGHEQGAQGLRRLRLRLRPCGVGGA
ncbi:hypothetical protein SHJGH_0773 [Streptomyces hygroscopicus subsp. jinggangensis TL01]|nr:hypothetical protein SHJGH_0773 [Streptomyces hygroscopicus subsp. jinggangensis TL01]